MGSGIFTQNTVQINPEKPLSINLNEEKRVDKSYDIEVIQVSNIALAIKNKQHTVNVELSLRCENLPAKAFGSTDSMIVIRKNDDYLGQSSKNFMEIGRTQVIFNELNPKFINTFIFPFNEEKNQQIQFRVYHMLKPHSEDLSVQKLIGTKKARLDSLVEVENTETQVDMIEKTKSKTMLKVHCIEYDGGNSKYQIGVELANFTIKSEVYFLIETFKFGQWIPIHKSESKRPSKFKEVMVPLNKFQLEESSGVRIKIYDNYKDQQIGTTKQFPIDISSEEKTQTHRAYYNGFGVGSVVIYRWKKIIRDSFISYIVGGAQLRLLVAIDFTNSNNTSRDSSLHDLDQNGNNSYIDVIREIGGVLQYFCMQNQIAAYGFGAKLPPYFKGVSQCFALNEDYFSPNVEGGIDKIIQLYKQNKDKIKMHGPTNLSEILQLAIKYASEEQSLQIKTLTYYILLIITDGAINDYEDTIDNVVKASTLPLSIVFAGVGQVSEDEEKNPFKLLQYLDSDTIKLKSPKSDQICERDIVDLIKIDEFKGEGKKLALARQTFAQIPNQFIDYMTSKNIPPAIQKKSLKSAKAQFITQKIKSTKTKSHSVISSFLEKQKQDMKKKLIKLGFNRNSDIFNEMKIAMNDLSYLIERNSQPKAIVEECPNTWTQTINIKESKDLQAYLDWKENQNKRKTLEKLQKIEANKYGRKKKEIKKKEQVIIEVQKQLNHPCLKCRKNQIEILHMECGHSSVCKDCSHSRCFLCYHWNQELKILNFNDKYDDY